jgi:hypothetical protein
VKVSDFLNNVYRLVQSGCGAVDMGTTIFILLFLFGAATTLLLRSVYAKFMWYYVVGGYLKYFLTCGQMSNTSAW